MIPKVIHYCWFGREELPDLAKRCIESWKKYCYDYKIIRWDESNINLNENDYIKEAYKAKKWAFITDYVRLKVLYEYGGIYMDTDIEIRKPLDSFLTDQAFSGFEDETHIQTGIIASEKNTAFIKTLLDHYHNIHFILDDGEFDLTTNVTFITRIAKQNGFIPNNKKQTVCEVTLYPSEYFCPKDYSTGNLNITDNTVCIHHFDGSWHTEKENQLICVHQSLVRKYGKNGELFFKLYKYITNPKLIFSSRIFKNIGKKRSFQDKC
jgi:mannosyltransferase OCH1-like enzyme